MTSVLRAFRLAAVLLAFALLVPAATAGSLHAAPAIFADEGKEEDDGNRGHGNDPDGVDEDNPGNSKGNDKKDKKDNGPDKQGAVEAIAPYAVDVACEFEENEAETACTFTGLAPEGAADVGHIVVAATEVCAEVTGGAFEAVDPDPATRVTGYRATGAEGMLTLVLSGEVTTEGTATYWVSSGAGVFPAEGPGLSCALAAAESVGTEPVEATFDTTPVAETGSLTIRAYGCTDVPADTTTFDWFGNCDPAGAGVHFSVTLAGDTGASVDGETGADGAVTFDGLVAGAYAVDLVDGSWCHAKSDRVDANSEVTVDTGTTSTVWIFTCGDGKSGT